MQFKRWFVTRESLQVTPDVQDKALQSYSTIAKSLQDQIAKNNTLPANVKQEIANAIKTFADSVNAIVSKNLQGKAPDLTMSRATIQ
jgi:hypothetical protein